MSDGNGPGRAAATGSAELQVFLDAAFDPVQYARSVMESSSALEGVEALKRHQATVEAALSAHVTSHDAELLGRLTGADQLGTGVKGAKKHAQSLSGSVGRLTRDISQPFGQIKADAERLRNVLKACKVLDRTRRFVRAVTKLRTQLEVSSSTEGGGTTTVIKLPESARDLAKAAQVVHEVEFLIRSGDLEGIHVVKVEHEWISKVGKGIRTRTEMVLNRAITEINYQAEVAPALQAFFNLGNLAERVDAAVDWVVSNVVEEAREALDAHALDQVPNSAATESGKLESLGSKLSAAARRSTTKGTRIKPPQGQEAAWRDTLWSRVEALEVSIRTWSLRVWNLQRVLAKKRDPLTHVCFADEIQNSAQRRSGRVHDESVYAQYWRKMCAALNGEVEKASRAYPFVRGVLGAQGYPRLRNLFRTLPARLAQRTANKSVAGVGNTKDEVVSVLRAFQPLLELFLAQSHHRLKEMVEQMFPKGLDVKTAIADKQNALPTRNDVLTFAKTVSTELAAAKSDADLASVLARGVANAVGLFRTKAEGVIVDYDEGGALAKELVLGAEGVVSSDAKVIETLKKQKLSQAHDIAMLNLTLRLETLVREMPEKSTPSNAENREQVVRAKMSQLEEVVSSLECFSQNLLSKWLTCAANSIHTVVARIHRENFAMEQDDSAQAPDSESSFMSLLGKALQILRTEHLEKLPSEYSLVSKLCVELQARVVALFTRHIALVRPVNSAGRLRLANELAQFELAVSTLSLSDQHKLADIGAPYQELRGLRQLLFIEMDVSPDEAVAEIKQLSSQLRPTTLFLAMFANAPAELRSLYSLNNQKEIDFVKELDSIEGSTLDVGDRATCTDLALGTLRPEPRELVAWVKQKVSAALDNYMQMLSGADVGAVEYCAPYHILRRLVDL
mmetsp:Transcript_8845/g.15577  ORF Transcript_8845/g.15577 Transcript_8845/m.15577 type:complete len:906 (+) Transcript_8845:166-2883(+)